VKFRDRAAAIFHDDDLVGDGFYIFEVAEEEVHVTMEEVVTITGEKGNTDCRMELRKDATGDIEMSNMSNRSNRRVYFGLVRYRDVRRCGVVCICITIQTNREKYFCISLGLSKANEQQ